jgi:uncharacterized membrane protein
MGKFLNVGDVLVIAVSSFVVIWGINRMLRSVSMPQYQA